MWDEFRNWITHEGAASRDTTALAMVLDGPSDRGAIRSQTLLPLSDSSLREIRPVAVTDSDVRARDLAAGIDKTLLIAKIAEPKTAAPAYNPPRPIEDTLTLQVAFEPYIEELRALGWHVESAERSVSVRRYFKNGKPRKGEAAILFNGFSIDAWTMGMAAERRP